MARDPYTGQSTDIGPLFHRADPPTSRKAAATLAESGQLTELQQFTLTALREYHQLWGSPCTCEELAGGDRDLYYTYQRRMHELEHRKLVRRAGTKLNESGREATRWEPTTN